MKKYIKKSLVLVCVLLVLWAGVWAINTNNSWWQVVKSADPVRIDAYENCYKVSASSACSGDVFVPTNSQNEWRGFIGNHPSCVTLDSCISPCVLRDFIQWAGEGTITKSKIRNAMVGSYNYQLALWGIHGNHVLWYGELVTITGYTDTNGNFRISYNPYTVIPLTQEPVSEFELNWLDLSNEWLAWGCFDDGSYRVNSRIYSEQITYDDVFPWRQTTRPIPNFGAWFDRDTIPGQTLPSNGHVTLTNRMYWCKSELLPNPDKYCVERLVFNQSNATQVSFLNSDDFATAVYFKEFTNNYAGTQVCASQSWFADERSFINLQKEHFGTSAGDEWCLNDGSLDPYSSDYTGQCNSNTNSSAYVLSRLVTPYDTDADLSINWSIWYWSWTCQWFNWWPIYPCTGSKLNQNFVYLNTTWYQESWGTQIFWFYNNAYSAGNQWVYRYWHMNVWGYTYHINAVGFNWSWISSYYLDPPPEELSSNWYFVKIPLSSWYGYYMTYEIPSYSNVYDEFLSAKYSDASWAAYLAGIPQDVFNLNTFLISKNVCVSFDCPVGMVLDWAGPWCHIAGWGWTVQIR